MAQLVAIGAYFYQAAMALGLTIVVAHLLPAADYTVYSFFVAISQFAAIAGFEWVRAGCSRFYPGSSAASEMAERHAIRFGGAVSALACLIAGGLAWSLGLPAHLALFGAFVSVLQGATDLHLSMLRFRLAFRSFSWLQGARATILAVATLLGAAIGASLFWTLAGLCAGYLLYCAILLVLYGTGGRLQRPDLGLVRKHFVYGSVSAGASIASLLAPIGLRVLLTSALGAAGAAGALLAIDLLQRPLIMVAQAVQGACYPSIVSLYDRARQGRAFRHRLGHYYGLLIGFTLMAAAGLVALLEPGAGLLVASDLRLGFLAAAPFVIAIAACRTLILTLLPTPAHLQQRLSTIIGLALLDCLLLNAAPAIAMPIFGTQQIVVLSGAAAGAAMALIPGLILLRTIPFSLPWLALALAAAGLAIAMRWPLVDVAYGPGLAALGCVVVCCLSALWLLARGFRPEFEEVPTIGREAVGTSLSGTTSSHS